MKKLILVCSILALILAVFSLAVGVYIALHGAMVNNGTGSFPGAETFITILTVVQILGVGLALIAAILSLVVSARSQQWTWFIIILLLIPLTIIAWYCLDFGILGLGMFVVVLPLVTLLYVLIAYPAEKNPTLQTGSS